MIGNVNLSDCEYAVGGLLQDLDRVQNAPAAAAVGVDSYSARPSYVRPDQRLRTIVDELREHESAIRGFLAQQTGNLETTVRKSADVSSVPAAHLSRGADLLNHERDRCRTLLEAIADGLATASRCASSVVRSSPRMNDGLESQVGFYRKPRDPHHEYYGAPSVMYETLHRLHPGEKQSATSGAPPVPNLKKRPTERERTLIELVRLGHGMIEVPVGESYWMPPHNEQPRRPEGSHGISNFGAPYSGNDSDDSYRKPAYVPPKAYVYP